MNLFKVAYKVVRENSDEIYKGLGFKHHSDAAQYYVHPNNQSFKNSHAGVNEYIADQPTYWDNITRFRT